MGSLRYSYCLVLIWLVLVAVHLPMAKTHLEHQQVKVRQNIYNNVTSATYDPYTNYDVWEGVTTAVILGTAFFLAIVYITFKFGWQTIKRKLCAEKAEEKPNREAALRYGSRDRPCDAETGEDEEPKVHKVDGNMIERRIPIVLQDGTTVLQALQPSAHAAPPNTAGTSKVDTYTMVVSDSAVRPAKSPKLGRPASSASERAGLLQHRGSNQRLLPPSANQVLRTAHWVNAVSRETVASLPSDPSPAAVSQPIQRWHTTHGQICDEQLVDHSGRVDINHSLPHVLPVDSGASSSPVGANTSIAQDEQIEDNSRTTVDGGSVLSHAVSEISHAGGEAPHELSMIRAAPLTEQTGGCRRSGSHIVDLATSEV